VIGEALLGGVIERVCSRRKLLDRLKMKVI
jgi:hypothetical protein